MTREARVILALEGPRLSIPLGLVRRLDGDLQAAAFLAQAAYLSALIDNPEKEGWFFLAQTGGAWLPDNEKESIFATMGSWEFCLGLSPDAQKLVRKKLIVLGLLEERRAGIPARLHYRVDPAKYFDFLAGKPIKTPVSEKPGNKNPGKQESRIGKIGKQRSGKQGNKTPAYPESNKEIEEDIEKEAAPHTRARYSAAAPRSSDNNKRRRQRSSGIVTWNADDELEAERIERAHGPDEIGAAVAALVNAGKEPVPGSVAARIKQRVHRKTADQAAASHRAAGEVRHKHQVAQDTAALAVGEQLMPAGMRGRVASANRLSRS
ncbi:hypothetical protein [Thiobacillus denitrificans]|nr:hypothetical protein [Thiobacillus denitrificans]